MKKELKSNKKQIFTTLALDDDSKAAIDLLKQEGFNISKIIRDFLKNKASELNKEVK